MNVAKLIAQSFAKFGAPVGVQAATLIKVTPGTRTLGAISAGTNPTTTSHAAKGLVDDFQTRDIDGTLIKAGDRRVTLFGASIAGGAVPEPGDRIAIDGETLTIVDQGVRRDPAKATYSCQCRR